MFRCLPHSEVLHTCNVSLPVARNRKSLQSGALPVQLDLVFILLLVLLVLLVFLPPRVLPVLPVRLVEVDVGVEVRHDGEDDEDEQQQAGEEQELFPLDERDWLEEGFPKCGAREEKCNGGLMV